MKKHSAIVLALMLVATQNGCIGAAAVGGGVTAGALGERRGTTEYFEDSWVANKIRANFLDSNKVKLANINVSVYKGEVLLTGAAASDEEIEEAIRISKHTRGVTKVASELKVQHESFSELASDLVISNHVKIKLLADSDVRGIDIHVETTKGVVYLTGTANTVEERDRAVSIARGVAGVKEVVSYINVDSKSLPVTEPSPPNPVKSNAPAS